MNLYQNSNNYMSSSNINITTNKLNYLSISKKNY